MNKIIFLAIALLLSFSANVYYWLTYSYTTPAYALCDDAHGGYKPIHGILSDRFLDVLIFAPYYYTAYVRHDGRRKVVRIPVFQITRWANIYGYDEILNRSIKHLDAIEKKHGIKIDSTKPNCRRMARWMFEPVGKPKKIDCQPSECRVLGVEKTAAAKK